MAAPAVGLRHPHPDPVITDPAEPTPEPTPTIEEPTQTPSPVPEQPAPVDTIPAPTPTTAASTVPISNPVPSPATKRARATKRPSRAGVSMRTRNVRYSPMAARSTGSRGRARPGHSGYRNGWLRLADDAYAPRGGRTGTALRQWYRAKRDGFGHRDQLRPDRGPVVLAHERYQPATWPPTSAAVWSSRTSVAAGVGSCPGVHSTAGGRISFGRTLLRVAANHLLRIVERVGSFNPVRAAIIVSAAVGHAGCRLLGRRLDHRDTLADPSDVRTSTAEPDG